jgi:hypothetical protein
MNQETKKPTDNDEIRPEYDFASGVRGKHHVQYKLGSNVVVLDADVAEVFHDAASVNEALRMLVRIAKEQTHISRSA